MQTLTTISIHNFKSCKEVLNLELSDFTPLIGYNNAGKSNVLAAIQWVLRKSALSESSFFDPANPVRVEATITGVTQAVLDGLEDSHKNKVIKYVKDGVVTIRREQAVPSSGAAGVKLYIRNPAKPEGDAEAWDENPTGIDNAISAMFPEPIQIGAMEDAGKDIGKFETSSTIGKLIGKLMAAVKATQGHKIADQLEVLRKMLEADGVERAPELNAFDTAANKIVEDFFPGVSVKVHVPAPEISAVFKSGTIRVYEKHGTGQPVGRDVSSMGHGAQRAIQMALVRQLAETSATSGSGRTLLLVDEPELYMHPQAVAKVRSALRTLSKGSYQVVFTTHSPLMIGRDDLAHTIVLFKTDANGTTKRKRLGDAIKVFEKDAPAQLDELFSVDGACQVLFSDRVVIGEGKTEAELLPDIFEGHHKVEPADKRVGIVPARGSGSVAKCLQVLDAMGIPAVAIVDLDYAFKHAHQAGLLGSDDADVAACKKLFSDIAAAKGADVDSGDGCFRAKPKTDKGIVAECYAALAVHADAKTPIQNIKAALQAKNVWLWTRGTIEEHVGINGKDHAAWRAKRADLRANGLGCCADPQGVEGCAKWMSGD